jgi:hypothetical protein
VIVFPVSVFTKICMATTWSGEKSAGYYEELKLLGERAQNGIRKIWNRFLAKLETYLDNARDVFLSRR